MNVDSILKNVNAYAILRSVTNGEPFYVSDLETTLTQWHICERSTSALNEEAVTYPDRRVRWYQPATISGARLASLEKFGAIRRTGNEREVMVCIDTENELYKKTTVVEWQLMDIKKTKLFAQLLEMRAIINDTVDIITA